MREKEFKLEINGKDYSVTINKFTAQEAEVTVNGNTYNVDIKDLGIEQVADIQPQYAQPMVSSPVSGQREPKLHRPKSLANPSAVTAPLPGLIQKLLVKVGDEVKAGQNVLIMEAMKMENEIQAKSDGVIKEIKFKEGDSVEEGEVLVILE